MKKVIATLAGLGLMAGTAFAAGVNINAVTESTPGNVGTAACNWQTSPYCRVTGTATALTALSFSNPSDGSEYIFEFDQDATGETLSFPTGTAGVFLADGSTTQPSIQAGANNEQIFRLMYNATLGKYIVQNLSSNPAGNIHNTCNAALTLSSGAVSTTGAGSCFTNYKTIGWVVGAGSPTAAMSTPTALAGAQAVVCSQAAANSQTISCTSSTANDARVINVFGVN